MKTEMDTIPKTKENELTIFIPQNRIRNSVKTILFFQKMIIVILFMKSCFQICQTKPINQYIMHGNSIFLFG